MTENMKAQCPKCKRWIIDNCRGCQDAKTVLCDVCVDDDGIPLISEDVNWVPL